MVNIKNQKILCISAADRWDGPWKGRHQIMELLLQKNQVLFVEEPQFSLLSLFRCKKRIKRLWSWIYVRRKQQNLYLYTPLLCLPFGDKFRIINRINNFLLFINLSIVLILINFKPTILYLCYYTHSDIINLFGAKLTVYNAHDIWEAYQNKKKLMELHRNYEEETIRKVDIAIFSTKGNMERKAHLNSNSYYLPHGCPVPPNAKTITEPVNRPGDFPTKGDLFVGYWGMVDSGSIDIELIEWLCKQHPEWTFMLIGPVLKSEIKDFGQLAKNPNVVFLGRKTLVERYNYLCHLDVGLLCSTMTKKELFGGSQLKIWEYISAGLPVVSIPAEESNALKDYVYTAASPREWEQMIEKAVVEDSEAKKLRRLEFSRCNSWEKRVEHISAIFANYMAKNQ